MECNERKLYGRIYPEACAVNFEEIYKRLREGPRPQLTASGSTSRRLGENDSARQIKFGEVSPVTKGDEAET